MEFLEKLNTTVSHEMLTPLNCIIAFSLKIITTTLDAKLKQYAELIKSTSFLLKMTVNDLLDRKLIQNKQLELCVRPC